MNTVRVVPLGQPVDLAAGSASGVMAPFVGLAFTGGINNNLVMLSVNVQILGPTGSFATMFGLPDNADDVLATAANNKLATIARLTGFEVVSGNWQRLISVQTNAEGLPFDAVGRVLEVASVGLLNNGVSLDRLQSGSAVNLATLGGVGAAVVADRGEWSVESRPAVGVVATATRAAGGVGVRNVCRSLSASVLAIAAQGQVDVVVRDGAAGLGAVLWSTRFALALGASDRVSLSGINIVGTANTAMTIEFLAAPAATNFEGVAMTGCLAS